jgi:hypothetical protein
MGVGEAADGIAHTATSTQKHGLEIYLGAVAAGVKDEERKARKPFVNTEDGWDRRWDRRPG